MAASVYTTQNQTELKGRLTTIAVTSMLGRCCSTCINRERRITALACTAASAAVYVKTSASAARDKICRVFTSSCCKRPLFGKGSEADWERKASASGMAHGWVKPSQSIAAAALGGMGVV